jgi:hypothetical protein
LKCHASLREFATRQTANSIASPPDGTIIRMKSRRSPSDLVLALSVVPFVACALLYANSERNMRARQEKLQPEIELNKGQADAALLAEETFRHSHLKDTSLPVLQQQIALNAELIRLNLKRSTLSANFRAQARPTPYSFLTPLAMIPYLFCVGWRVTTELQKAKRRKNNLCLGCGYSVTANVSGICPECGQTIEAAPSGT